MKVEYMSLIELNSFRLKTINIRQSLLAFIITFVVSQCLGKDIITVSNSKEIKLIGKGLLCFPDTNNAADISYLLTNSETAHFKPLPDDINTFPLINSQLWFKFEIRNLTSENIFLEVGEPSVNSVELYKVNPDKQYSVKSAGYFLPFRQREVSTNNYLLNLDLPRDSSALYLLRVKMKYKETITVPLSVGTISAFLERSHRYDLLAGIFYGILLLVVVFNLIMFLSGRDRSYLYFSLHAAMAAIWVANYYGNAFEFLWPYNPVFNRFTPAITAASSIFVVLFSRHFLRTADYAPILHKGLYLLLAAFGLTIVLNFLDKYFTSLMVVEIAAFIMCIYLTILAVYVSYRGFSPAKIYLLALLAFFSGIIIFLLQINGMLTANVFTRNSVPIGTGVEIGLISFALGNRLRFYRLEKKKTQMELIKSYEENERLLINLREQELRFMSDAMEVQENERRRIASDLHDRLGSMLSTVKVYFNSVEDQIDHRKEVNKEQYNKATTLLDEACEEVRKISHNLVSGELVKFGLVPALRQMAKTIEDATTLKIKVLTFGMEERPEISVEIMLHSILQELLNNILKHSGATEVLLQLNRTENNLNILLEDNGVGFNTAEATLKDGIGLENIEIRVSKLNGRFHIDSVKGRGTTTIIDIPV